MKINVYFAGTQAAHLQKRSDRGEDVSNLGFCGADCSELHLVSLPPIDLHASCPECDKQLQMLRKIS